MRRDDWLVGQLPVGMVQEDFFYRFASIFQHVGGSLVDGADNLDKILDASVTTETMVRYLGSWIGLTAVDASLPHEAQRLIVRTCARILSWRGTLHGLTEFVRLMSGGEVEVRDSGGVYNEGGAPMDPPRLQVRVASTGLLPERDFALLVRDEVPANVFLELWVGDRPIWPPDNDGGPMPTGRTPSSGTDPVPPPDPPMGTPLQPVHMEVELTGSRGLTGDAESGRVVT